MSYDAYAGAPIEYFEDKDGWTSINGWDYAPLLRELFELGHETVHHEVEIEDVNTFADDLGLNQAKRQITRGIRLIKA